MAQVRRWLVRDRALELARPLVMGILNLTPDSFFDGGRHFPDVPVAVSHAEKMLDEGADIVDIGGESTRPGSKRLSEKEELARVLPVIEELMARRPDALISIDTYKTRVAEKALAGGAAIVNDISAGRMDEELLPFIAESKCGYVLMHMLGTPDTMQVSPSYDNVVGEIHGFLQERLAVLEEYGIDAETVVTDPGIGFGKRPEDNLALIAHASKSRVADRPLLFGVSRKSFLGHLLGREEDDRLHGTTAAHVALLLQGVEILRVHDVGPAVDAVKVHQALKETADGD
jgi:dihydropteroate synthase